MKLFVITPANLNLYSLLGSCFEPFRLWCSCIVLSYNELKYVVRFVVETLHTRREAHPVTFALDLPENNDCGYHHPRVKADQLVWACLVFRGVDLERVEGAKPFATTFHFTARHSLPACSDFGRLLVLSKNLYKQWRDINLFTNAPPKCRLAHYHHHEVVVEGHKLHVPPVFHTSCFAGRALPTGSRPTSKSSNAPPKCRLAHYHHHEVVVEGHKLHVPPVFHIPCFAGCRSHKSNKRSCATIGSLSRVLSFGGC